MTLLGVPGQRLTPELETATYYVVAEALTNAVKHAGGATAATIRLELHDDFVLVKVADDGRGGADPDGPGLRGLANRLAALGGRLHVDSPRGEGTTLGARLPTT